MVLRDELEKTKRLPLFSHWQLQIYNNHRISSRLVILANGTAVACNSCGCHYFASDDSHPRVYGVSKRYKARLNGFPGMFSFSPMGVMRCPQALPGIASCKHTYIAYDPARVALLVNQEDKLCCNLRNAVKFIKIRGLQLIDSDNRTEPRRGAAGCPARTYCLTHSHAMVQCQAVRFGQVVALASLPTIKHTSLVDGARERRCFGPQAE